MTGIAPERLVFEWLGEGAPAAEAAVFAEPFHVPYDRLAGIDGWVVWLGHPPVPEDLPLLPAPDHLIFDDPATAIATGLLVAADYAVRRGARDVESAAAILARESPVAIVAPGDLHRSLRAMARRAAEAGVAVVIASGEASPDAIRVDVPAFAHRAEAHAVDLGRPHDPVLAFQPRVAEVVIGGNNASTFVVHDQGVGNGWRTTGALGSSVAIAIGLPDDAFDVASTATLEPVLALIPGFLDGVASWFQGDALAIGWHVGDSLEPDTIARAFHTWTKSLTGAAFVDVRIAFAKPGERTAEFDALRQLASSYNDYRSAVLAGHPDPSTVPDREMIE
jgi:hypothetical protein